VRADRASAGRDDPMTGEIAGNLQGTPELLAFAEEAGQLGLFEWHVQSGALQVSANFLSPYGLAEFDGRYDTWLQCVYREDVPRTVDLMD
jgi:hypothetical protein